MPPDALSAQLHILSSGTDLPGWFLLAVIVGAIIVIVGADLLRRER